MNFREIKEAVKSSLDVSIKTTLEETINNLDLNCKEKEAILEHLPDLLNYITNYTSYAKECKIIAQLTKNPYNIISLR